MKNLNTLRKAVAPFAMAIALLATNQQAAAQVECLLDFSINSGCLDDNEGWATVTGITGGTTPWTIEWTNGSNQAYQPSLQNGSWSATVRDALGCEVTKSVVIDCVFDKDEDDCQYRTQTQGGWGTACSGGNPGCYRDAHFAAAFPNGLQIGCTNKIRLTTSAAVDAFLPSSTTARPLNAGTLVNPGQSYKNVLAGQLVALTLSVTFDAHDPDFSSSTSLLADATVNTGMFQGWTVQMILDEANSFIGGCGSNFTAAQLNSVLTMINENYVDGTTNNGNVDCATKKDEKSLNVNGAAIYPNPAQDRLTVELVGVATGTASITILDAMGRVAMPATTTGLQADEMRAFALDMSSLSNGTYLVRVEQAGQVSVSRILVAR